ncbi:ABC transporter ATP-binding protein [Colwellia sp. RE-S-Sl-9]
MSKTCIQITNLCKSYESVPVLVDLNWTIDQGDIIGLLGKNGAGKSTLLNAIVNVHPADSGSVTIFDQNNTQLTASHKARIGYVSQINDEVSWLSIKELIAFKKQFYTTWNDEKVNELLQRWQLDVSKKLNQLSVGQAQRIQIILALAPEPDLIIFDEPAASLDPAGRRDFLRELVNIASDDNKTIVFSTHITSDLERVANKVAILHEGRICRFEELDVLKEESLQSLEDIFLEVIA